MHESTTQRPGLRLAAMLLAVTVGANAIGCFGGFNMTRNVYHLNENVSENRWAKSGTMLAFVAFQLYPMALAADLMLFNIIEFWHRNPIKTFHTHDKRADGGTTTVSGQPDGTLVVRVESADGAVTEARLRQDDHAVTAVDADGALLGRFEMVAGAPVATDGPLSIR